MLKLLIADQNEEFVESLSAFLTGRYQLFTCGNGREALEILRRERCDRSEERRVGKECGS